MIIRINEQISLSEYNLDDVKEMTFHLNNRKIYNNTLALAYPYTEKHAKDWIEYTLNQRYSGNMYPNKFAIRLDNKLIGGIALIPRMDDFYQHQGEIGYWISEDYWNKGYASICVDKFTDYVFENFPIRRLTAAVFKNNKSSMKVLEKNNYTMEGLLREYIFKDGKFIDCYLYSKLRKEHHNQKNTKELN